MYKYVIGVVIVATLSFPAHAEEFSGPFVGTGLTFDNYSGSGDAEGIGGVSGIGGTAYAGYDYKINDRIFIGAEANADFASADADVVGIPVESEWGWGVSGRLGYKINDKTALYTRAGYARQRVQLDGEKFWLDAIRYGGGLETFISDKIAVRAEYSQFNAESNVTNNQVTAGLLYRF